MCTNGGPVHIISIISYRPGALEDIGRDRRKGGSNSVLYGPSSEFPHCSQCLILLTPRKSWPIETVIVSQLTSSSIDKLI